MNDLIQNTTQNPAKLLHFHGMIPDLFFDNNVAQDEADARAQIRQRLIDMFDADDVGLLIERGDRPTTLDEVFSPES